MSVYTNKSILDMEGNEIAVKKLKLDYQSGTLNVYHVQENEDGTETEILSMVQPWKCHNDGTRSDFVSEQDAYDWFESVKNTLG